jgi:hypothetical protein
MSAFGGKADIGQTTTLALYERHGTRLRAQAPNPTMHRASVAKTATLNSASIMRPSIESRLIVATLRWDIPSHLRCQ